MAGIPIEYRTKDFQNSTYKKCSLLVKYTNNTSFYTENKINKT